MDSQRLRNLTTGVLHTEMGHIYEDIEAITGAAGVMTHQLPNACRALEPYLREHVKEKRFWDEQFDTTHTGDVEVPTMTEHQQAEFRKRFGSLPSPLAGKNDG